MLARLLKSWKPAPVRTRAELTEFLDRHASVITNRSVIGYCQVKTRLPLHELTCEAQFAAAFARSRAESYAAVLADLLVVAAGLLRDDGHGEGRLVAGLAGVYRDLLDQHGVPAHRPEGWGDVVAELEARLALLPAPVPGRVAEVARRSAQRLYETLPIHERLRAPDQPAIMANVQFLIVGLYREFERRLDRSALAQSLAG
jgi:hypothetical protein